jgi:para-nitrobenzyl esterase
MKTSLLPKKFICFLGWGLTVSLHLLIICPVSRASESVSVEITAGNEILIGQYTDQTMAIAAFKGIPYAAPPVEERRWQAPQKHQPRTGKQLATKFANACYQDNYNTQWYQKVGKAFGVAPEMFIDPNFSEDCLYLNIWTPSLHKNKKLPVMVWIHGGSNKAGWSFEQNYIGTQLAQQGQVIVVSIAYRLGVFGFISHPELTQNNTPANFGLLDQIEALKWINKHIEQFGGDSSNITLFGESAGAANIGNLILSPPADGLFQRAISQSGGFQLWNNADLKSQQTFGHDLAIALDMTDNSLTTLKKESAKVLFNKAKQDFPEYYYGASVDGYVLPDTALNLLFSSKLSVDLLIGSNQDEWLMYLDNSPEKLTEMINSYPKEIHHILKNRAQQEQSIAQGHDQASTLIDMVCPGYAYAQQIVKSNKRAYIYRFKQVRSGKGGNQLQAYHGAEIPYVFNSHDDWLTTNKEDQALTTAMIRYWTNFAKNGDPNDPKFTDLPNWPQFDENDPKVLALSEKTSVIAAPDFSNCQKIFPVLTAKLKKQEK